jgi:HK97 family phage major capsid protein
MLTYLKRLVDERTNLTEIQTRMADSAATEDRDLTDTERAEISNMQARCAELDKQIGEHNGQLESQRSYADLMAAIAKQGEQRTPEQSGRRPVETTSLGRSWVESEQFRSYSGHGSSARYQIEGYLETRAAITTANLSIPAHVLPPIEQQYQPQLVQLVNQVRVGSGTVSWVVVGPDPVAAVVAEGAVKPEAAATFTPASAALDTIAHYYQITRQALDDASYMQSLLEGKLRRGLAKKVDQDIATLIEAITAPATVNADLNTAIRQGVGVVEGNGYSPNGVLLNPADLAKLDVAASNAPGGNPAVRTRTYWGLTPVAAAGVPVGTTIVGDFQSGVTLFDRGVTDVFITDSHASLFVSNILVILAEGRFKSVIDEPNALCKTTLV